jgi:hypothetical protein
MLDLKELNALLADQSYISGPCPSDQDCLVFDQLSQCPSDEFPHLRRWYTHFSSFNLGERRSFSNALGSSNLTKFKVVAYSGFSLGIHLLIISSFAASQDGFELGGTQSADFPESSGGSR